jgi:hypothetical protein
MTLSAPLVRLMAQRVSGSFIDRLARQQSRRNSVMTREQFLAVLWKIKNEEDA